MDHVNDKKSTGTGAVVGGVAGGVTGGMAAGAAVGGMTGPVGAIVGAAVGAIAGAVAGRMVKVDHAAEDTFWRDNHRTQPYVTEGSTYEDYGPAYRHGATAYEKHPNRTFDEAEPEIRQDWGSARGKSSLEWDHAKHASRAAWDRLSNGVERAIPGDSDRDGR